MHRLVLAVLVAVAALAQSLPVAAGENYAVLIAVGDYDPKQLSMLPYARNDILEFYAVLLQSGFKKENVVLMHDDPKNLPVPRFLPESSKIRRQLTLMLTGRDEDDTVILAFAGHGVQFKGDKSSYFCPLDVELEKKETLIPLGEIYDAMQECGAKRKLLLVDACRDDPRTTVSRNRSTIDLESITRPQKQPVPESVVAFFSCAAGQRSYEWPDLKHGVFFYHVLDVWKNGSGEGKELTLDALVYQTRKRTETFARNTLDASQTPELHGTSAGKWVLKVYNEVITNSLGMKLVLIPAGEFQMGSPDSDTDAFAAEKPQHRVRISKPFYLGTTEVTQGQWKAVMGTTPWKGQIYVKEGADYAASYISWDDAQGFCRKLSLTEGVTYRLPKEAEWEYACRVGETGHYSFGSDATTLKDYAWFDANAHDVEEKYAHRVGLKKPNAWGLYDMHGNVSEWCADWYDEKYYARSRVDDPAGLKTGSDRVFRGGCWITPAWYCRLTHREADAPDNRLWDLGFRVARVAPSK